MSRSRVPVLAGLTGLAIAAPAAQAHVTLNPRTVTANAFARIDVRVPNEPGSVLTFPARQTYSNGEVVNWNGPSSAETPAPTLTVTAPPTATAAHTPLKRVSPKRNSTQTKAVKEIRATFKAKMQTGIIELSTSNGHVFQLKSSGLMSSNKAVIRAVLKSPLTTGTYKVSWRARAGDGHSEKGTWTFKVKL